MLFGLRFNLDVLGLGCIDDIVKLAVKLFFISYCLPVVLIVLTF